MTAAQTYTSPLAIRLLSVMEQANRFAAEHLQACCIELEKLYETGVLQDGRLRELAGIFREIDVAHALDSAIGAVNRQAIKLVAAGAAGKRP